jgi:UDP-N-acetylglucosamine--N-acetylmuramyl-(pentapeptide) pyrophosphoryl-undecaprenol N-acetylglucosamine transferase
MNAMTAPLCILAAGGTGGHLFPAQALAETLLARGWRVVLATDKRGEAFFGDRMSSMPIHRVLAAPIAGASIWRRLRGLAVIGLGTLQAHLLMLRLRPSVVVGFGGYPSAPTLIAAGQARLPILLHEQNSVMGRANRSVAPRAARIALSFQDTQNLRDGDRAKSIFTGNPVRAAIQALHAATYAAPEAGGPLRLLVTGGSQGARIFGEVVPAAIASLPQDMRSRLRLVQQVRAEDLEAVRAKYAESGVAAELAAFFTDMPVKLAEAHLAIGRAGASTVAEFAVAGVPAILVPLPSAADDHQTRNAKTLEAAGAAWAVAQGEFQPPALARRLFNLLRDGDRLAAASASAKAAANPRAAEALADLVAELAGQSATVIKDAA